MRESRVCEQHDVLLASPSRQRAATRPPYDARLTTDHGLSLSVATTSQSRRAPVQAHRFSVGEFVAFTEKRFPGLVWGAEWEVVGLLEGPDGQIQYRLRSPDGVSDDIVSEANLEVRVAERRPYPAA